MKNRHDKLFKFTFSHVKQIRELLVHFTEEKLRAGWDLSTIEISNDSFIDDKLKEYFSDIVFTCRTTDEEQVTVCFVLEHKSYRDEKLPLQLLRYLTEAYESQFQPESSRKMNVVVPIVIYHGDTLRHYADLSDMIKTPAGKLFEFIPTFSYSVINLSELSDDILTAGKEAALLKGSLAILKHSDDIDFVLTKSPEIIKFAHSLPEKEDVALFIRAWIEYIYRNVKLNQMQKQSLLSIFEKDTDYVEGSVYQQLLAEGDKIRDVFSKLTAISAFLSLGYALDKAAMEDKFQIPMKMVNFVRKTVTENPPATAEKVIKKKFLPEVIFEDVHQKEFQKIILSFYQNQA